MPQVLVVQPQPPQQEDDAVIRAAVVQPPEGESRRLWYRLPAHCRPMLSPVDDAFAASALFEAMRHGWDLHVRGQVSPSLLVNLEEFQAAWSVWRPDRYRVVRIKADVEREPDAQPPVRALAAFSGGVDSCFTVWRHRQGLCGPATRPLAAGVLMHGFDIPLARADLFDRAVRRSIPMLRSIGLDLLPVATNYHQVYAPDWEDSHAAALASVLMLVAGGFSEALIANSYPYSDLHLPWGSNPLTDPMLSSARFRIVHDGAAYTRCQKMKLIADWPEAMTGLRVCWAGPEPDHNCCRCEKCIRTILGYRALQVPRPPCFPEDVSDRQILALRRLHGGSLQFLDEILAIARQNGIGDSWVTALDRCVRLNRRLNAGKGLWFRHLRGRLAIRTRLRRLLGSADRPSQGGPRSCAS